jgi:hypothetical protein
VKSISAALTLLALVPIVASAQEIKPAPYLMRPPGTVRVLPPPEFDRPYTGKLTIERAETPEDVQRICNLKKPALACAFAYDGTRCRIVIVPDEFIRATGYTPEIVLRHERAHCLNWPADHPGQRPL